MANQYGNSVNSGNAGSGQSPQFGFISDGTRGDRVRAALALPSYLVVGAIANHGLRLLDVLNDRLTDFLTVFDVRVFPRDCKAIHPLSRLVVPKANISLVALPGRQHEAPEKRSVRHRPKKRYSAFLVADAFCIEGVIHLEREYDPAVFLAHHAETFIAVQGATVSNFYAGSGKVPMQVAIVQTACISAMHLGKELPAEPKPSEPTGGVRHRSSLEVVS